MAKHQTPYPRSPSLPTLPQGLLEEELQRGLGLLRAEQEAQGQGAWEGHRREEQALQALGVSGEPGLCRLRAAEWLEWPSSGDV